MKLSKSDSFYGYIGYTAKGNTHIVAYWKSPVTYVIWLTKLQALGQGSTIEIKTIDTFI